jgi:hypothetical protein
MLQPYPRRQVGDEAQKSHAAGGADAAQRCESLRGKIHEQRMRLASLPPDTHEAECCRRHIRFFEAQLRALEQAPPS